jgi:putative N-acetylmannosamine-6-phosphate epimerase
LSRERLELVKKLAGELATIKQDVAGYCTAEELKRRHPDFRIWDHLGEAEVREIAAGERFTPKAYAENLVIRHYGITSRETLKKDRRKLRNALKK